VAHDSDARASLDERRRSDRNAVAGFVRVRLKDAEVGGSLHNLSKAGVMFFSSDALRVEVAIRREGAEEFRMGRLVRIERVDGKRSGFAIEFDASAP
jgi:hypothetical protein